MQEIINFLDSHNIKYTLYEHDPVFTVAEASKLKKVIPGMHFKNLFFKDSQKKTFHLLTMPAEKRVSLNEIKKKLGLKKMRFAREDELKNYLNVDPGSVSPFGLLYDSNRNVNYYMDTEIKQAEIVNFHPNTNDRSIELNREDFEKFLVKANITYNFIELSIE